MISRFPENPLITPGDITPSRPDFEVVCAFNAGVTRYRDEVLLLMRVAERPRCDGSVVRVPVLNCDGDTPEIDVLAFDRHDATLNLCDPRKVYAPGCTYLTTLSHLRIARSTDGRHFTVDPTPALMPNCAAEAFGLEDPRITQIGDTYYIAYKSVGEIGISVSLAVTEDFVHFERRGIMFAPENMDVCIFPEQINGRYAALHRPVSQNIGKMNIWLAYSSDMLTWGDHRFVMAVQPNSWEGGRIGGSAVPIKTAQGWLEIYHAATPDDTYCLGAALLDLEQPERVIARSTAPLMVPDAPYEATGFLPNVVFSCGALVDDDRLTLYYGGADMVMAAAETRISTVLESLVG